MDKRPGLRQCQEGQERLYSDLFVQREEEEEQERGRGRGEEGRKINLDICSK